MTMMKLSLMSEDLPIVLIKEQDGVYILEWDENDPRCEEINTWTHDDWLEAIERGMMKMDMVE